MYHRKRISRWLVAAMAVALSLVVIWQLASSVLSHTRPRVSANPYPGVLLRNTYTVTAGDTILGIAHHFGVGEPALLRANHLRDPDVIYVGQRLVIPAEYHPKRTERLIRRVARSFGLDQNFALAIAYDESGFQQGVVSKTGAIGVMQVEPATAVQLSRDLGRVINLAREDDNVTAGLYYLNYLVRYYGGNERSAAAAYYEGQGNLARHGYVGGTGRYVAVVMALRTQFRDGTRS